MIVILTSALDVHGPSLPQTDEGINSMREQTLTNRYEEVSL
jgi:hypothetical protein